MKGVLVFKIIDSKPLEQEKNETKEYLPDNHGESVNFYRTPHLCTKYCLMSMMLCFEQ